MKYYLGIDLGGTNIAAGIVDENYNIVMKDSVPTKAPRSGEAIAEDIDSLCRSLLTRSGLSMQDVCWAGFGTPGAVDPVQGIVIFSNNLAFCHEPMVSHLEKRLGCKVYIDNDGNAAAYGEYLAGAGQGSRNMLMITLGTGIGGGIILDGKIYLGLNYAAGEIGHMVIDRNGLACSCGRKGCFEKYAAASALVRQTKEMMQEHPESLMWSLVGGDLEKVNGKISFDAAEAGDLWAQQVVENYRQYISIGLINLINIFQPDIICIGGGISKQGETLLAPVRELVQKEIYTRFTQKNTAIVAAILGNDAGIIGAAMLGRMGNAIE